MPSELGISEAAAALGVSVDTIRRRLRSGELTGRKVDGRWRVTIPEGAPAEPGDRESPSRPGSAEESTPDPADTAERLAPPTDELVDALQRELESRRREIAELHAIMARQAAALEQLTRAGAAPPALPPGDTTTESPEPVTASVADAQLTESSWWRRAVRWFRGSDSGGAT